MLLLERVPGIPTPALSRLADLGVMTAERLLRDAGRPETRRDLERSVGGRVLEIAEIACKRALGLDAAYEAEPEPPPAPETTRWSRRERGGRAPEARSRRDTAPRAQAAEAAAPAVEDVQERLAAIRRQLTSLSDRRFQVMTEQVRGQLIAPGVDFDAMGAEDMYRGGYLVLEGLDPTRQAADFEGKGAVLLHRSRPWGLVAIDHDPELKAIIRQIRDVQAQLGWPREQAWDVIGPVARISWTAGTLEETRDDLPFLKVLAIRIHGQFGVFVDPQGTVVVPGLSGALKEAERMRGSSTVDADATPRELIAALVRTLAMGDPSAFRALWSADASERDIRFYFGQFRKAWEAAEGRVEFESYGGGQDPEQNDSLTEARVFVQRPDGSGGTVRRPLTFRLEDDGWRIASGSI